MNTYNKISLQFLKNELKKTCWKIFCFKCDFSYEFRMKSKEYNDLVCFADFLCVEILKFNK